MTILALTLAVLVLAGMPAAAQTATRTGLPGHAGEMISAMGNMPEISLFTNELRQSDLYNAINSGGEYTIFAPTNEAFSRMPLQKANIMNQNQQGMDYVLSYHIVSGKFSPQLLKSTSSLTTLNTRDVSVSRAGNDLMIDGARIIGQGVDTANVVIYPISNVMIPPYLT